ncbi:MAG: YbjN domain-containing protein [Pseudomonadota bacterium]
MTLASAEWEGTAPNPLDLLEEIVGANRWPFNRASQEEMVVEVTGRWCTYRLYFYWEAQMGAMQVGCQPDIAVPPSDRSRFYPLLALMNERLWLGHMDLERSDGTPTFRYTALMRGAQASGTDLLEDVMEIAIGECDRFYPAIEFVVRDGMSADEALRAAITDTMADA